MAAPLVLMVARQLRFGRPGSLLHPRDARTLPQASII